MASSLNLPLSVVLALIVAFLNTVGYYFQKKGQNEIEDGLPLIKYLITAIKTPKWLFGFIVAISSMPLYIYTLSIGHISITQPLANTGIIFLVIFGIKFLGEKVGKLELIGLVMLLSGIFLISFLLPQPKEVYTLVSLELMIFYGIIAGILGACVLAILLKKKAIGFSLLAGMSMGTAATLVKIISVLIKEKGYDSFSILNIDLDIKLLTGILGGEYFFISAIFYLAVVLILIQMVGLILSFKAGTLTFVIPIEMGSSFILPVFAGFFIFHEPSNPYLIIGIIISLIGSLILTKVQASIETKLKKEKELV
ncbi:MAG: hypothetical protein ACFFCS_26685 [Candidatus Hodarchaeota archaeon]